MGAWILNRLSGVSWWRVGGGVIGGLIALFLIYYAWVLRPQEFLDRGIEKGRAEQKSVCDNRERERDAAIFKYQMSEQERRAKILAKPNLPAADLLRRMRERSL